MSLIWVVDCPLVLVVGYYSIPSRPAFHVWELITLYERVQIIKNITPCLTLIYSSH